MTGGFDLITQKLAWKRMTYAWRMETDRAVLAGVYLDVAAVLDWRQLIQVPESADVWLWADWAARSCWTWLAFDRASGRLGGLALVQWTYGGPYLHFVRLPHVSMWAAVEAGRTFLQGPLLTSGLSVVYILTTRSEVAKFAGLLGCATHRVGELYYGQIQISECPSPAAAGRPGCAGRKRRCPGGAGTRAPAVGQAVQPREDVSCEPGTTSNW